KEGTVGRAGQVEMQPPILVRRQALPLLVEIGAALGPGANARIGTQLRLKLGKGGIGAVVARVPGEQHARVGAGLASRLEVAQGNAGRGPNGVVGRDPRQRVRAGGIGRQRLEQVIVAIAMDLVEANEDRGFAVAAEHVAGGENLERAAAVATTNLFAVHLKLSRKVGVSGHELLAKAEIVAGLLLVIGEKIAVTAANGEAVERGEHKVGGLPILLGPAAHYEVVERRAVGAPGVEGAGEQVPAV